MDAKPLKPVKRAPLLYQTVQTAIQTYILENRLRAGDALPPESELARQLDVSRNSVREGIKALESLGILETQRGRGVFVKDFSFEPLLDSLPYGLLFDQQALIDLLEVRRILEVGLIESAMQTISAAQLERLWQVVENMHASAGRDETFVEEDREFHRLLFESLGNKTLLKLLDVFWLAFRKAIDYADANLRDRNPMKTYQAHVAILDSVVAGEVEQARISLKQHYDDVEDRLHQFS